MPEKRKPIVLHLITQAEFGGAQKYVYEIATGLRDQFTFVVGAGELDKSEELLVRLKREGVYTLHLDNVVRRISPWHDLRGMFQIIRCIMRVRPDIIHLHTSKMSVLGSMASRVVSFFSRQYRPKIIYTAHGWVFREHISNAKKSFYMHAERATGGMKDAIICLSESDRKVGRELKIGRPKRYFIIPNGVTLDHTKLIPATPARIALGRMLRNKYPQQDFHSTAKEFWIGTVANLYHNKGLDVLIEAIARVHSELSSTGYDPKFRAFIVGEGMLEAELQHTIHQRKLSSVIFLTGPIPDAWHYLKAFTVFVLPSRKEGFPFALIEAMAAGLPVIATSVGAIPEIITDKKDGILVPPNDATALATEILELIHHEEVRLELAKKGEHLVETNYTNERMLKEIAHLYHTI